MINISALFTLKFIILYIFIASSIYVHFRGKERLKIRRHILNYATFLGPINCLNYLFSAVPNRPFLNVNTFSELKQLRDNWQLIRDEAQSLLEQQHLKNAERDDDIGFNSFLKRGWRRFYLKWYHYNHPSALKLCPKTVALLNKIPSVKGAMFAFLPAHGKLNKHRDPFAGSLRYHLGLITPNSDDCCIYVDGQAYTWKDGEDVMFDETYVHHAYNKTEHDRIILFCDIERPVKGYLMRKINQLLAYAMSAASSPNQSGDATGSINKLYKYVHAGKKVAKTFKQKSPYAYRIVQYVIPIALFYFIFIA